MQSLHRFAISALVTVAASLTLSGCQMGSFPEASMNPEQASLGTISGSNFGGHAPLVGAHVYVLQPSVTTAAGNNSSSYSEQYNAYGYQATSILNSTGANNGANNPTPIQNSSDPGIPTTWYYQKADLTGAFNITGDYTCTVGLPVYLYLYGGMPQYPSANNTFSIAKIVWSGSASPYTVTMTINTSGAQNIENAYIGEFMTMNGGFTSAGGTPLNGSDQVVIAGSGSTGLTTTQFSFSYTSTLPAGVTIGTTYTETGSNQVTFLPTFNPAVVNLAVLGNCPSGGFTGANAISYVFVNEVSTVAAAYAFRPFTLPAGAGGTPPTGFGTNSAIYIGTSSTNIAGLQNAANVAKQLYDIQGSNVSTTYAGEGHIARSTTVNGNGIVPQANIDTIGNILAACVDSNNGATTVNTSGSYNGSTGAYSGISSQCNTLFETATNTGIPTTASSNPGTQPYDTAMAAINMARYPAGPPYSYTGSTSSNAYVSTLFALPTGNVPFAPYLTTQPNDFTIAIDYTAANNPGPDGYPLTTGAESVAIDKIGNVWFTTQPNKGTGAGYLSEVNPVGVFNSATTQYNSSYIYGYVDIDTGETPWAGSAISTNYITYVHANSTPAAASGSAPPTYAYDTGVARYAFGTTNYNYTYPAFGDSSGNMYFSTNITASSSTDYIVKIANAATAPTTAASNTAAMPDFSTDGQGLSHSAIDATGAVYLDYNAAGGAGTPQVGRNLLSTGANASGTWPVTPSTSGCSALTDPEQLATLAVGDVIVPDYYNGAGTLNGAHSNVFYITAAGACTALGSSYEAGLYSPFGAAVDGNDNVFITNRGGSSISVIGERGGSAASTTAISPYTGYIPQYLSGSTLTNMLSQPLNIAIDPSGNAWVTDYGNNSIVQIIGIAVPATTPLSAAAIPTSYTQGSIGFRP